MNDNVPNYLAAAARFINLMLTSGGIKPEISREVIKEILEEYYPEDSRSLSSLARAAIMLWATAVISPLFVLRYLFMSPFKLLFLRKSKELRHWESFEKMWYSRELPKEQSEVPPQVAIRLLSVFSNDKEEPDTEDHIAEEFEFLCKSKGVAEARRWVWKQTRASVRPFLLRTIKKVGLFRIIR